MQICQINTILKYQNQSQQHTDNLQSQNSLIFCKEIIIY